jgi:hypothetical protein
VVSKTENFGVIVPLKPLRGSVRVLEKEFVEGPGKHANPDLSFLEQTMSKNLGVGARTQRLD